MPDYNGKELKVGDIVESAYEKGYIFKIESISEDRYLRLRQLMPYTCATFRYEGGVRKMSIEELI